MKTHVFLMAGVAAILAMVLSSCSVISKGMRQEAEPPVPFAELIENVERYRGKTVILGGYIIGTVNRESDTVITVLQTPLGVDHTPHSLELTEGRFKIVGEGFLDPEVYARGRQITVAGVVDSVETLKVDQAEITFLILTARELHIYKDVRRYDIPYPVCCPRYWHPYRHPGYYW